MPWQDDAASVRQSAVDLLGSHIGGQQELALVYFDTLAAASRDASTSVRKAAVKILWEACIRCFFITHASILCLSDTLTLP